MISLQVPRRAALAHVALALSIVSCGRATEARARGIAPPPCPAGALDSAHPVRATLVHGACAASDGIMYADFATSLLGGHAYLIRVIDHPDSGERRAPHRRFDATLLSVADSVKVVPLLNATPFEGRDPAHTISQLLFIAPATGPYTVRVRGHEPRDAGAFDLVLRECGGGTLDVGRTSASSLGAGSCLEQMSFGADSGYADLWRLHLTPDQRVTISVLSDGRSLKYLHIAGPGLVGEEAGGDVNRLRFTARLGGDYTVLVGQLDFDQTAHPYAIRVAPTER